MFTSLFSCFNIESYDELKKTICELAQAGNLQEAYMTDSVTCHGKCNLLGELHHPSVGEDVGGLEPGEAGLLGQAMELLLRPLFPTRVVSQHDEVDVEDALSSGSRLRNHR
ncbi:unnamed protein product [Musa acuminata subsp. burmannicoides]